MSRPREIIEGFYRDIDREDYAAATSVLTEDVDWSWGGVPVTGRARVRDFLTEGGASLGHTTHTVLSYLESGGLIATELSVAATHSGPLRLLGTELPATGRPLTIRACHHAELGPGGLIRRSNVHLDLLGILSQLGVLPG